MIEVTPTASLVELVYTALALFGVAVMVYTAIDCWRDLEAVKRQHSDGVARETARLGIRESVAGAMCHSVFFYLGLFACLTPPPPPDRRLIADLYAAGFIIVQATIISFRAWNQMSRIRIRQQLRLRRS